MERQLKNSAIPSLEIPSKKKQIIAYNKEYLTDKEYKINIFIMKFQLKLYFSEICEKSFQ